MSFVLHVLHSFKAHNHLESSGAVCCTRSRSREESTILTNLTCPHFTRHEGKIPMHILYGTHDHTEPGVDNSVITSSPPSHPLVHFQILFHITDRNFELGSVCQAYMEVFHKWVTMGIYNARPKVTKCECGEEMAVCK